jgi:hypothetical protein
MLTVERKETLMLPRVAVSGNTWVQLKEDPDE